MTRRIAVTGGSGFIGTNLIEHLRSLGDDVINLDRVEPKDPTHRDHWRSVELLDADRVSSLIADFGPTHLMHLAARTDLHGTSVDDYQDNTVGTENVLGAIDAAGGVEMLVNTSTLLVCKNGYRPTTDIDFCPETPYGQSKQQAEMAVREWGGSPWVTARPTSIWGPWFGQPYRGFFETVLAGRYVNPGSEEIVKAFGYVGNTVAQLERLLSATPGTTHYLADQEQYSIDAFASTVAELGGVRSPRTVPIGLLRVAARVGDVLQKTGVMDNPPLTSFRLKNMQTPSSYQADALDELTGPLPHDMRAGVQATLDWLASQ